MESGLFICNLRNKLLLIGLLLVSCQNEKLKLPELKMSSIDSLRTGDLICRLGNGYFSKYFKQYASKEKKYSHIGIISIEMDSLFVYHSEASELTGIGSVKRESLNSFLSDIRFFQFYSLTFSDSIKQNIIKNVKSYYNNKTPFDLDFNSFNDNKMYCSELIATSINKAVNANVINPTLILSGKRIYSLDDIYNKGFIKKHMLVPVVAAQEKN